MNYAELWAAMKRLNLLSPAWLDFLGALERQLDGALLSDVAHLEAPTSFSDYWSAVAAGKSPDYDAQGAKKVAGDQALNFNLDAAEYPIRPTGDIGAIQSIAKVAVTLGSGLALGLVWGGVVYLLSDSLADSGAERAGVGSGMVTSRAADDTAPDAASSQEFAPPVVPRLAGAKTARDQSPSGVESSPATPDDDKQPGNVSNNSATEEERNAMRAESDAQMKDPSLSPGQEQTNADFDDTRRAEPAQLAAETPKALQGAANAAAVEQPTFAQIDAGEQATDERATIAANAIEDRLQAARQRTAEQATAAVDDARRAEPAQLAAEPPEALQGAANAAAVEQPTFAQTDAGEQATDERATIAANAIEDRLQAARQRTAEQATAAVDDARRAEPAQLAAEPPEALQGAANAAAVEQPTFAQTDAGEQATDERATIAANAIEDRLQAARQRAAEQMAPAVDDAKRAEPAQLAAETPKALQGAVAAAEQPTFAQIEADKPPAVAAEKAVDERAMAAADALEDRLEVARHRAAQQAAADFDDARRGGTARLAAETPETPRGAADTVAAEQATFARIEADKPAAEEMATVAADAAEYRLQVARQRAVEQATADFDNETSSAPSAGSAAADAIIRSPSRGHASGLEHAAAGLAAQALASPADVQPLVAPQITTGSIKPLSVGNARKNERPEGGADSASKTARLPSQTRDRGSDRRSAALGRLRKSDHGGEQRSARLSAAAFSATSVVASLNRPEVAQWQPIFMRRCPSILQSSGEYDDDLVSLCRTWEARR